MYLCIYLRTGLCYNVCYNWTNHSFDTCAFVTDSFVSCYYYGLYYIDKWVDIIFYPFEIIRDKIDNYRQKRDLESWYEESENNQEEDTI